MSSSNICTISDVADVYDGPHATPKKIDEGFYFLSISSLVNGALDLSQSAFISEDDFKKWTKRVTPEYGDILFSYETRLGDAALMPDGVRACLGRRMGLLRPKREKVIPEYLLYAYLSPDFQAVIQQRKIHGATVDRIALKDLPNFPIRIPSIGEQRKVVDSLSSIDSKIQLNRQINQTLEQMAQAIFQSWFVDFEPVKAKIAAREDWLARQAAQSDAQDDAPQFSSPVCYAHEFADAAAPAPATQADLETFMNRAAMCAISGKTDADLDAMPAADYQRLYHTASLFPDELVESELGDIPKGWEVDALSERIIITGGGTPKRSEDSYWNGNIPWFSVKDVPADGNVFVIETDENITELGLQKSSTKILEEGTTIVTARGTVGKLALVGKRMCMNQSCYGITGKNFGPYFNYFNMREAVETLKRNTHGAVFDTITTKTFDTYRSCYPDSPLSAAFDDSVTPFLMQIKNNLEQIKSLTKIRDSLLPKLLSGEIEVPVDV